MKGTSVGLLAVLLVVMVLAVAAPAAAHDYERGNSDYPLRYVAYLFHPVGMAFEYGVTRPVHQLASQPYWRFFLGHDPRTEIDEHGNWPVCNLDKPPYPTIECPLCHKKIQKPRDVYWAWR